MYKAEIEPHCKAIYSFFANAKKTKNYTVFCHLIASQ